MLDTDLSPVSVGIRLREVKAFVRWLHFEGHLTLNPWVSIELPTYEPKPRFLTNDELATLEQVCPRRFLPLVRMAYLTGMRKNEILKANWEDISWIKGRAFLTVEATTAKNRRSRTIPLRAEVVKLLGSRGKGRIFAEWDVHKIRWAWECVKKAAKFVGRVRFHDPAAYLLPAVPGRRRHDRGPHANHGAPVDRHDAGLLEFRGQV
jgi:integrase